MWEYLAILLGTGAFLVYLINLYVGRNADFWKKQGIRTLENDLTLFQLLTGRKIHIDFDMDYYEKLGDEKFGGSVELGNPVFFVKDLDIAKNIMVKDFDYFIDRRNFGKDPVLKESLFFLEGQEWKDMRAFLSPTFTSGKIRRMFENFGKSGQRWKQFIKTNFPKSSNGGHNVLVGEATKRFTVDIIGAAAFGMETDVLTNKDSRFYKMCNKTSKIDLKRIVRSMTLMMFPKIADLLGIRLFDSETNEFFISMLSQALKARESSLEDRGDFLQLLVEAQKGDMKIDESELNTFEKDAQIKPSDLKKQKLQLTETMAIAQGFLFFVAGFDTVSNFLNQAIYVLCGEPEIQEKIFAELENVIQAHDGKITYEGTNKMEYLDMFVSEVMRLYPPALRLERKCVKDYPIPGTDKIVPKGSLVAIPVEGYHRDARYYPDPMKFSPERFNAENKAKRNAYTYQPFGVGPRNCIGMRFALIEAKVALANLVYNFVIQPSETTVLPVKFNKVMGTFRTPDDLVLKLVPRSE